MYYIIKRVLQYHEILRVLEFGIEHHTLLFPLFMSKSMYLMQTNISSFSLFNFPSFPLMLRRWSILKFPSFNALMQPVASALKHVFRTLLCEGLAHTGVALT